MSKTKYKVWIQIEKINEDKDIYENVTEPEPIGEFKTCLKATEFTGVIAAISDQILSFHGEGLAGWNDVATVAAKPFKK